MSRIHGRNGMVYLAVNGPGGYPTATGTVATPLAFVSDYTINFTVAKVDVTALGDANLTWVSGLPDASGDFTGFYDTATAQTYVAATDGLSRNFYLYPSLTGDGGADINEYFYGTILPDFAVAGGVSSAVTMKSTWNAASQVQKYPPLGIPGS